jgi:hypothetical protein
MAARSLCPGFSRVAAMTTEQSRRLCPYFNAYGTYATMTDPQRPAPVWLV